MSTNEYLFPFALVPRGKKILLYGAGKVGRVYAKQLLKSNYAELVGFVDRYASSYNKMIVPVYSLK